MSNNKEIVAFFAEKIQKELGIVYAEANYYQLENRLKDIAIQQGLAGVEELYNKAKAGLTADAKQLLFDTATNNETSFYRDQAVFDGLQQAISEKKIPGAGQKLKIWSAACSSGQEPYSILMLLEEMRAKGHAIDYSLLATDISSRILQRAKTGEYSQLEIQRGLPLPYLLKYFEQVKENSVGQSTYRVKTTLKKDLSFQTLNLLHEWPGLGQFHLLFCRNVLIYQTVESKERILQKLSRHILPGGYLILGAAESIVGLSTSFQLEAMGRANFYRLKSEAVSQAS